MNRFSVVLRKKQILRIRPWDANTQSLPGFLIALAFIAFSLIAWAPPAAAHVGSPDVFLEGNAGPYKLFVTVRVPQVIPGIAEVEIRSESNKVSEIRIAPMQLTGPGSQFAPAPELAERSKDDPQFFRGSLWLMEFGSLQVRIEADGADGQGRLAVPIPAVAQRVLPMQRPLGALLFVLMVVLSLAMISIVAAAVREGNLAPGVPASAARQRRVRLARATAGFVVAAVLTVGGLWWRADAKQYASHIYTTPEIEAAVSANGQLTLRTKPIRMTSGNPRRAADLVDFNDLMLDHEHLMHLFIVRSPGMDVFWHLHPSRATDGFAQNLPAMPAGRYQVFADVVLSSGFPVTMIGQIDLASAIAGKPLTGDDSGIDGKTVETETAANAEYSLPDGGRILWERDREPPEPLRAGIPLILRFRVTDRLGNPSQDLEPYMGMAAHAAVIRSDGSVFAHVHPTGSVPMASFELAQASLAVSPQGTPNMPIMDIKQMSSSKVAPEITIPYGFPKAGLYRVFVQVKRSGRIQTAVFDVNVK
jgi:hypothetical protein